MSERVQGSPQPIVHKSVVTETADELDLTQPGGGGGSGGGAASSALKSDKPKTLPLSATGELPTVVIGGGSVAQALGGIQRAEVEHFGVWKSLHRTLMNVRSTFTYWTGALKKNATLREIDIRRAETYTDLGVGAVGLAGAGYGSTMQVKGAMQQKAALQGKLGPEAQAAAEKQQRYQDALFGKSGKKEQAKAVAEWRAKTSEEVRAGMTPSQVADAAKNQAQEFIVGPAFQGEHEAIEGLKSQTEQSQAAEGETADAAEKSLSNAESSLQRSDNNIDLGEDYAASHQWSGRR